MTRTKNETPRRKYIGIEMKGKKGKIDVTDNPETAIIKKRRSLAITEIRHYQQTTHLLISRMPFQRLVREISANFNFNFCYQVAALEVLQVIFLSFFDSYCVGD